MPVDTLPKYVQEANRILEVLNEQPDRRWSQTQRELGEHLEISQPILSVRLKQLEEHGRIQRGEPLPMRGRNFAIELLDATPFDGPIRSRRVEPHPDDRVEPEPVELPPTLDLGELTPEKVGMAILQTLHDMWEKEEQGRRNRVQLEQAVATFRSHLAQEHRLVGRLQKENERLAREKEEAEELASDIRRQMNELIISKGESVRKEGRKPLPELLDEDSRRVLQQLKSEKIA